MAKTFFELLGIGRIEDFDPRSGWASGGAGSALPVPVGYTDDDRTVEIDMGRFQGLDDHYLAVGEPAAGVSDLLETIAYALTVRRSGRDLSVMAIKGSPDSETFDGFEKSQHCSGVVNPHDDLPSTLTVSRLTQALAGEIHRRREALKSIGASNISEYQKRTESQSGATIIPETFVVIENATWLFGDDFNQIWRALITDGHDLAIRLLVGVPYSTWDRLGRDHFEGIAPRFTAGLTGHEASKVFDTDVPDAPLPAGQAYMLDESHQPLRFHLVSVRAPYTE